MFITFEKTCMGVSRKGRLRQNKAWGSEKNHRRSVKVINADAERCREEEHQRKVNQVLPRGSISFCFSGSPFLSPNMEQHNLLTLKARILKGI